MAAYDNRMNTFIKKLQRRQVVGPYTSSKEALQLLKIVVKCTHDFTKMEYEIKRAANLIQMSRTSELSIGNMFRRVLKIVRDSAKDLEANEDMQESKDTQISNKGKLSAQQLKERQEFILQSIDELQSELLNYKNYSIEHVQQIIDSGDIILTSGYSELILKAVTQLIQHDKIKIKMVVLESFPTSSGEVMAEHLQKANIPVTLIRDTNILNIMPYVTKVLIEANAVLATGALLASQGTNNLAQDAAEFSKPFYALVGHHQLTPFYLHGYSEALNDFLYPEQLTDHDILVEPYRFYQKIKTKIHDEGDIEFLELGIQYNDILQGKDTVIQINDNVDAQLPDGHHNEESGHKGRDNLKQQFTDFQRKSTRLKGARDVDQPLDPQLIISTAPSAHVYNQRHDYINENFVNLIATDLGNFIPAEVETVMLNQLYDQEDFNVDDNYLFDLSSFKA